LAVEQHPVGRQQLIEPIEFADIAGQHRLTLLDCLEINRRIVQERLLAPRTDARQPRRESS
jgi:hypothetical protein